MALPGIDGITDYDAPAYLYGFNEEDIKQRKENVEIKQDEDELPF